METTLLVYDYGVSLLWHHLEKPQVHADSVQWWQMFTYQTILHPRVDGESQTSSATENTCSKYRKVKVLINSKGWHTCHGWSKLEHLALSVDKSKLILQPNQCDGWHASHSLCVRVNFNCKTVPILIFKQLYELKADWLKVSYQINLACGPLLLMMTTIGSCFRRMHDDRH